MANGNTLTRIVASLKKLGIKCGDPRDVDDLAVRLDAVAEAQGGQGFGDDEDLDLDDEGMPDVDGTSAGVSMSSTRPPMSPRPRLSNGQRDAARDMVARAKRLSGHG